MDWGAAKALRVTRLWADSGFKNEFIGDLAHNHRIDTEIVEVKDLHTFKAQPRR